uniref:Uncharacterized protein n=1 Tax=Arion vulgaris TaxID=1028688 RepID=A0A0B6YYD6_9EUPU
MPIVRPLDRSSIVTGHLQHRTAGLKKACQLIPTVRPLDSSSIGTDPFSITLRPPRKLISYQQ